MMNILAVDLWTCETWGRAAFVLAAIMFLRSDERALIVLFISAGPSGFKPAMGRMGWKGDGISR